MSNLDSKIPEGKLGGAVKKISFELLKPLAVAIIAAIGSVSAYILTPLNETINSFIWKEKAELLLISQNSSPSQGEILNLDLFIQPTSPLPISDGTLVISYPKNLLRPAVDTRESLVISTPKLTSSTKINQKTLEFITESQGKGTISVSLKTKNGGIFSAELPIEVGASINQIFPSLRNFSGDWNIDLGNIHGSMKLRDVGRTISGEYHLSDGSHGQIEGLRDGKTFRVTFYRGTTPSRYFIEATFDPNPDANLEIKGKAILMLPAPLTPTQWKSEGDFEFYATGKVR